jgi:signal transduction histidine kinase
MNERYNRTVKNSYVYFTIELSIIVGVTIINMFGNSILNLVVWIVVVALCAYFLFFEDFDRPLKRIIECEVLLLCMGVCESLGVVLTDWFLRLFDIEIESNVMQTCLEVTFSKIIMLFIYYMFIVRLMRKKNIPFARTQYIINFIILIYSLINMFVIAEGLKHGQANLILTINMGCIVIADLALLYLMKVTNEKIYLEYEIKSLEKQADLQYRYYVRQEQKYKRTVQILHDVNNHVKSIEQLFANGNVKNATEYALQIEHMLKPLIPIRYTGNPILDILLTDKAMVMEDKDICFDIKVDNVNLDFIDAIDVTTIFGNLLDNAVEACENLEKNRKIFIKIGAYHQMVSIRIENTCANVKWKNGLPISEKGKNRGWGLLNVKRSIEKYDGNIKLKIENGKFIVDIFLNS